MQLEEEKAEEEKKKKKKKSGRGEINGVKEERKKG